MLPDRASNPGPLTYESGATRPGNINAYKFIFLVDFSYQINIYIPKEYLLKSLITNHWNVM